MRTREEVLHELISFAQDTENIRALVLQGSHINDNAPKDVFSDLDPLFYVRDVRPFLADDSWKDRFGDVISFFHDAWAFHEGEAHTRLTLYRDGFKIDFGFQEVRLARYANEMELYKVYVDKDGIVPQPEVTDERKFFVKQPTELEFQEILRDFFFDSSYVVKTLFRDEITFNQYMVHILHKKILKLAEWYIGCQYQFHVNTGIHGRYLKRYLSAEEYNWLKATYPGADREQGRQALITSFDLVHHLGTYVSDQLHFTYPQQLEDDMRAYCRTWMNK